MDYKAEYATLAAARDKLLTDAEVIFQKMMKLQFLIDHGLELKDTAKEALEVGITAK